MPKKKPITGNPELHKDLKKLDFKINTFGSLNSSLDIDALNTFLDNNVKDKKLKDIIPSKE